MKIYKALEAEHSAENRDNIIEYIGDNKKRFDELMESFLSEEWRICQRASWPLGYIGRTHPQFLTDYHDTFLEILKSPPKHAAATRNILRIYEGIKIPEDIQGRLFDVCLDLTLSTKQPIAVRAFSLGVISNIAQYNPELIEEILIILEDFPGELSSGLRNRLNNVRKKLQRLIKG